MKIDVSHNLVSGLTDLIENMQKALLAAHIKTEIEIPLLAKIIGESAEKHKMSFFAAF